MTEDEKFQILSAKYNYVITDPYPEIAIWEIENQVRQSSLFDRLLTKIPPHPGPDPYTAWRDGFEFAWNLINKQLDKMDCKQDYTVLK